MMILHKNSASTTQNVNLLVAAIDHLLALYLANPEPCLCLLIKRNYTLLLEQNATHPDRKNWLNQQQIWWRCYLQSNAGKPNYDLLVI